MAEDRDIDPSEFVQRIRQLGEQHDQHDAERVKKLQKDYDDAVKAAAATNGTEGCEAWLAAESGLIANADIVPFANSQVRTFGKDAEFAVPGQLVPLSIRMTK